MYKNAGARSSKNNANFLISPAVKNYGTFRELTTSVCEKGDGVELMTLTIPISCNKKYIHIVKGLDGDVGCRKNVQKTRW